MLKKMEEEDFDEGSGSQILIDWLLSILGLWMPVPRYTRSANLTPPSLPLPPSCSPPNSIDNAVKRFKREVNKSGHLLDLRFKRYHESNQEKVKRKAVQARRKARMLRLSLRKGQKL